jgi:hypothetical protein
MNFLIVRLNWNEQFIGITNSSTLPVLLWIKHKILKIQKKPQEKIRNSLITAIKVSGYLNFKKIYK